MLLTIISTLLGILASTIPSILRIWERNLELKYEKELTKLRMEAAAQGLTLSQAIEEIKAVVREGDSIRTHDMSLDGGTFVNALRASVRPVITYILFGLFIILKITIGFAILSKGISLESLKIVSETIMDEATMSIFSTVVGFWFGRVMGREIEPYMGRAATTTTVTKTTKK